MPSQEFQFVPPPEAPVFRPTWEEFQDALQYINKIRPVAEQYGICKIIPPPDWQPPFAVDVDNFKFTPRIQRINELEAHTRIKLNFLDQIAKFWDLQGSSLKIPVLEKKALDLYSLHKRVQDSGGADNVTRSRGWNRISSGLGFPAHKNLGSQLKHLYEKLLKPFEIFTKSKEMPSDGKGNNDEDPDYDADKDYKPHQIPTRMTGKIPENEKNGRRSRRYLSNNPDDPECDEECSPNTKELKRLQFKGAGPKNADVDSQSKDKGRSRKGLFLDDPLAKYMCLNCGRGDAEEHMLLCDGCDDSYHTFCLLPALIEIPKGDWRCPKCVALEVSKPMEAFGFEQAQKEYTLQTFGEMADKFKQDYFNMPVHLVPTEMAEQEFWRVVSSIDEDVTVEYGADLHTMDHGSGFPTLKSNNLLDADKEYASDSWNLNNLPIQEGSVLAHIGCDISGMKVPWMYVGMCFSTFCWHNEDHWSYSINYLHWGEPKTWYGVPGSEAEKFEQCMKSAAPELFQSQPDLLHQLVTIMNPNILMREDVPIVRCDQHAGEFMITFPRSYHAGFNQGYNFAEAVNFAPPDWLPIGRECIAHYSKLKRYCVFSHDELVAKMASSDPESLDLTVAAATYQDMLKMVEAEKKQRRSLLHWGVSNAEREAFELLPDDGRQCDYCKTTCFLSAVTCSCTANKLVCLKHYTELCQCAPNSHVLRYRYTLDELPPMLQQLKERAESFDNWATKVKSALEVKVNSFKLELDELKDLAAIAEEKRFPESELLSALIACVAEAEKCAAVAGHLAAKKVRTRTRGCGDSKSKLTLEELRLFHEQITSLACVLKEEEGVRQLLSTVVKFQADTNELLTNSNVWLEKWKIERLDEEDSEEMEVDGEKKERKKKKKKTEKEDTDEGKENVANIEKMDCDDKEVKSEDDKEVKSEDNKEVKIEDTKSEEEDNMSERIRQLLELGYNLDIDLPELFLLKTRLEIVVWLEEVQESVEDPDVTTSDVIKKLLSKSVALPPHSRVEQLRSYLHELLNDINEVDGKASTFLQTKDATVEEVEELTKRADTIPAVMPHVNTLRDALKKAKEWQSKASSVFKSQSHEAGDDTSSRLIETVETLLNKARSIPLKLSDYDILFEHVKTAKVCLDKMAKTFLKKNSQYSLIEVLLPRVDIGLNSIPKKGGCKKGAKKEETSLQQAANLLDITTDQAAVCNSMIQAYKDCGERELRAIRAIRSHNINKCKSIGEDDDTSTFCVCHKAYSVNMIQCTICADYFHPGCVHFKGKQGSFDPLLHRFSCMACCRTRRPRVDVLLNLLQSMMEVKLRSCEIGALQCMSERFMGWQDRARSLLNHEALIAASEVLRKAINALQDHRQLETVDDSSLWAPSLLLSPSAPQQPLSFSKVVEIVSSLGSGADEPLVNLNPDLKLRIRDLLLEGDLLETTAEENQQLWRLLQISDNSVSKLAEFLICLSEGNNPAVIRTSCTSNKKRKSVESDPKDESGNLSSVPSNTDASLPKSPKKPKLAPKSVQSNPTPESKKTVKNNSGNVVKKPQESEKKKDTTTPSTSSQTKILPTKTKPVKTQMARPTSPVKRNNNKMKIKGKPTSNKSNPSSTPTSEGSSEDDEICAAAVCKMPVGEQLNWIQCDGCNEWYHYICVGLKAAPSHDEQYFCLHCKHK